MQATKISVAVLGSVLLWTLGVPAAQADDQDTPVLIRGDGLDKVEPPEQYYLVTVEGEGDSDDLSNIIQTPKVKVGNPTIGFVDVTSVSGLQASTGVSALGASGYSCVKNTTADSGLRAMSPSHIDLSNGDWEIHYTNHLYAMQNARYVSGGYTTQFEQCTIGGSRNKHTYQRMAHTESEVSINNSQNRLIGWKWGTAVSNGSTGASLGFEVAATKSTKISGTLSVSGGGSETGSVGTGKCGSVGGPVSGNQVNGAWHFTYPGYGTNDFKGNVAHALYEFAQPAKSKFAYFYSVCYQPRY